MMSRHRHGLRLASLPAEAQPRTGTDWPWGPSPSWAAWSCSEGGGPHLSAWESAPDNLPLRAFPPQTDGEKSDPDHRLSRLRASCQPHQEPHPTPLSRAVNAGHRPSFVSPPRPVGFQTKLQTFTLPVAHLHRSFPASPELTVAFPLCAWKQVPLAALGKLSRRSPHRGPCWCPKLGGPRPGSYLAT